MIEIALLSLAVIALSLGCVQNWRYLRRVRRAGIDDRAARERALARYRRGETPTRRDEAAASADRRGNRG